MSIFFNLFQEPVSIVKSAADELAGSLATPGQAARVRNRLAQTEHECDLVLCRITDTLRYDGIPKTCRAQCYRLARLLGALCGTLEEAAFRWELFQGENPPYAASALVRVIQESCACLDRAFQFTRTSCLEDQVETELRQIDCLEDTATKILRDGDSLLVADATDVLALMRCRELHAQLKAAVDICGAAARLIGAIFEKLR